MHQTALTVGGFTQPVVAKSLIELPSSAEKGFAQRFLWILPQPKFSTFESLQLVDDNFTRYLGNNHIELQSPVQAFLHSSLSCIFCCGYQVIDVVTNSAQITILNYTVIFL